MFNCRLLRFSPIITRQLDQLSDSETPPSVVYRVIKGQTVTVDAADAHLLDEYTWFVSNGYVVAQLSGVSQTVRLHNLIKPAPDGLEVDHADGNPFNNTRDNLRHATRSQNCANRRKFSDCRSVYKGVSWHKRTGKWQVIFTFQGKQRHLGLFTNELDAASAYDDAALEHFGEYARINFPHRNQLDTFNYGCAPSDTPRTAAP